jgi:hypothetical protein
MKSKFLLSFALVSTIITSTIIPVSARTSASATSGGGGGKGGSWYSTPAKWRFDTTSSTKTIYDPSRGKTFTASPNEDLAYIAFAYDGDTYIGGYGDTASRSHNAWLVWSSNRSLAGYETSGVTWGITSKTKLNGSPLPSLFLYGNGNNDGAINNGFYSCSVCGRANYAMKCGSQWLQAVAVKKTPPETIVTRQNTIKSIYRISRNDSNIFVDNRSASDIYNNPRTSVSGSYKSQEHELSFNHRYSINYIYITQKVTYVQETGEVKGISYSSSNAGTISAYKEYERELPNLDYKYAIPYNLMTGNPDKDKLEQYMHIPSSLISDQALDMNVSKDDNSGDLNGIHGIDNNTPIRFNIHFNNNNFGIPDSLGYKFFDNFPIFDNSYAQPGSEIPLLYNLKMNMASTTYSESLNKTSLQLDDTDEFTGTNCITKDRGWTGGNIYYRSIAPGLFALGDNNYNPFFTSSFIMSKYYKYGLEYNWTATLSNFSTNDTKTYFYNDHEERNIVQPELYGLFNISYVKGYDK